MQLDPKADCRPWPLAGYAPGNYTCKCIDCEERFSGDKRAIRCLECAAVVANQRLQAMPVPVDDGFQGFVPHGSYCATEGCGNFATVHFIRGGIGSLYCQECYLKVQALGRSPSSTGRQSG